MSAANDDDDTGVAPAADRDDGERERLGREHTWVAGAHPGVVAAPMARDAAPMARDAAALKRKRDALTKLLAHERGAQALTIERTLGQGGMGVVQLATQRSVGRKVAVKTVRPGARSDTATIELLREAWVTGALEHPNVVPVYDVSLDEHAQPVIVLKRIDGVAWSALLHDEVRVRERYGARDMLEWNLQILMQVCNAVHFAHSRGIVHRDIKPGNVMVGEFGEVYVVDWGIAVSLYDDGTGRLPLASEAREVVGTPSYMAPEMFGGPGAQITARTDVYLLGAVLYQILTGVAPHRGVTFAESTRRARASNPWPPSAKVPVEIARIAMKALERDPDARYQSAEQFRLALLDFIRHRESATLMDEANRRLDELRTVLRSAGPSDAPNRQRAYNLFGECRFGFRQALRTWADNEAASAGLACAVEALAEYELARGDPSAASLLLSELTAPPPALARRVADAAQTLDAERRRLQRLEREHDPATGRDNRIAVLAVLGTFWGLSPLLQVWPQFRPPSHRWLIVSPILHLTLLAVLSFRWREMIGQGAINRRIFGCVVIALSSRFALDVVASWLGVSVGQTQTLHLLVHASAVAMFAFLCDLRMLPSALSYFAAMFVAARFPTLRPLCESGANALIAINAILLWRHK